jgi:5'-3' exonuclease
MGIPSYYRRLVESVPALVGKVQLGTSCDWLWIDFNCIVYHCLRRPGAPVWNGLSGAAIYEAELRRSVIQYVDYLISCVGPVKGVGLAVDGVVPAAKRRQQRLRRVEAKEGSLREGWDTNAITPGTAFMNDLMADLERWRAGRDRVRPEMTWMVSPCTEPGEGEHKIMSWLRALDKKQACSHMIYGLDADLILLTVLNNVAYLPNHEFKLYREEQKGGETVYGPDGKEKMLTFNVDSLINYIVDKSPLQDGSITQWIIDYVLAMSVLGNDFVPCMMSLSLKDEGHGLLLEMLARVWRKGGRLNCGEGWRVLFEEIAMGEKERIIKSALTKRSQAARQEEDGPCKWFVEDALFHTLPSASGKEFLQLRDDYQDVAAVRFSGLRGAAAAIREHQAQEYMRGLQWISNYYMLGAEGLDFDWYYPSWIAPFAHDIVPLTSRVLDVSGFGHGLPTPEEQLALVLPKRSWRLLAGSRCATFAEKGVEWFGEPTVYSSICKRARWECHLNMPSPLLRDLRRAISGTEV